MLPSQQRGLTETQLKALAKRRAFREKIAARAVPDSGLALPRASQGVRGPVVVPMRVAPDVTRVVEKRQTEDTESRKAKPHGDDVSPSKKAQGDRRSGVVAGSSPAPGKLPEHPLSLPLFARCFSGGIDEIKRVVANYYRIDVFSIDSSLRTARIVRPRYVAMFLARKMTHLGSVAIGKSFGGRERSTVCHGARTIEKLAKTDPKLNSDIQKLRWLLIEKRPETSTSY